MNLPPAELAQLEASGYLIEREIGRGTSGVVYLAQQPLLERRVALKRVPDNGNPRRLDNEVAALVTLEHPGVVRLMEVQRHPGAVWFVMEYVDGPTLRQVQGMRPGPLPAPDALGILEQLSVVLDHVSSRGVVHRDLKPGNVFITSGGRCKIGDFGIALIDDPATGRLTLPGVLLGTPVYLSPEQASGQGEPTAASDLYSLGVIAYELLAGRAPFRRPGNVLALLAAQASEPPPPPRMFRPELTEAVESAILAPLAKEPAKRPASAGEFFSVLSRAADRAWPGWREAANPVQVAPARTASRQAPSDGTMTTERETEPEPPVPPGAVPPGTVPPGVPTKAAVPLEAVPTRAVRTPDRRRRRGLNRYLVPGVVFVVAVGGSYAMVRALGPGGGTSLKVDGVHLSCRAGTVAAKVVTNGGRGALVYRWSGGDRQSWRLSGRPVVTLSDRVALMSRPGAVVLRVTFYVISPQARQASLSVPAGC